VKKKIVAASVSSTEAFPTAGLSLQVEVSTVAVSIPSPKEGRGRECWNSDLDARLEAVAASIQLEAAIAATSKSDRLRETLPTTSWVLDPYENPIT
jgi:hypothetical protein